MCLWHYTPYMFRRLTPMHSVLTYPDIWCCAAMCPAMSPSCSWFLTKKEGNPSGQYASSGIADIIKIHIYIQHLCIIHSFSPYTVSSTHQLYTAQPPLPFVSRLYTVSTLSNAITTAHAYMHSDSCSRSRPSRASSHPHPSPS